MTEKDGTTEVPASIGKILDSEVEAMTLDRLVSLADNDGLVRMGLGLMEAFAQAEGRVLWH